jgi:hypothetical protein
VNQNSQAESSAPSNTMIVDSSLPLTETKNVKMLRVETGGPTTTPFNLLRSKTPSVEILPQLGHDF